MSFLGDLAALGPTATTKDPRYLPLVLEHVRAGNYAVSWAPVTSTIAGHAATFYVMSDALRIEGVRVVVDAWTHQQICDVLGCSMLTAKVADLRWYQRTATIDPTLLVQTRADLEHNTDLATMLRHSRIIDQKIAALGASANLSIVCDVGKLWILRDGGHPQTGMVGLVRTPSRGINYGVYGTSAPIQCVTRERAVCKVYQDPGSAHPAKGEPDYSQIVLGMRADGVVDGMPRELDDVRADPELAALLSDEGVMRVFRQPNVPAPRGPLLSIPSTAPALDKCPNIGLGRIVGTLPAPSVVATPELAAWMDALLGQTLPLGTVARDTVNGRPIVGRIECAQGEGGAWRRGVALYVPGRFTSSGAFVARTSPAPGWPGS